MKYAIVAQRIVVVVGAPLVMASSCERPDLSGFEKSLNAAQYIMYYPTRANWGPNTVLSAEYNNGKLSNVREVCPALYVTASVQRDVKVTLADYSSDSDRSFNVGLSLLKGALGPQTSAKLGLSTEDERKLSVSFADTVEDAIPDSNLFTPNRRIEPGCALALQNLKSRNELTKAYLVTRAVRAGAQYDMARTSKFSATADASITKEIGAEAGAKWNATGRTTLKVANDSYVGAAEGGFMRLIEFLPQGEITGGFHQIQGTRVTITKIEQ